MLKFGNRKLQQVRGSFFVPLPPEWIKSNEMKKSDPVKIELLDDNSLRITPVPQARQDSEGTGAPTTLEKECRQ
jgi:phosphate uptake regulator